MLFIYLTLQNMVLFHQLKFSMDSMLLAYILLKKNVSYLLVVMIKLVMDAYLLMSLWMHFYQMIIIMLQWLVDVLQTMFQMSKKEMMFFYHTLHQNLKICGKLILE